MDYNTKVFKKILEQYKVSKTKSLIPLLPLLKVQKNPMSLENHFQFEGNYKNARPKREVWKCARQVGKSYNISGANILRNWFIEYYETLFVLPRFTQMKRLSTTIVDKLLRDSPFSSEFFDKSSCKCSVDRKTFTTNSAQNFSNAFLTPDPVRGFSGVDDLIIDEAQDMDWDHLPIIEETVTASLAYGFITYSGTPKTLENTLTAVWEDSSQGEWCIKCTGCNKFNIAAPQEQLMSMIDIKGLSCAFCGKLLDTNTGYFVHAFPEKMEDFIGRHVPQTVHPHHCNYPHKWKELMLKRNGKYNAIKFSNEVLGVEKDSAARLITKEQLKNACDPSLSNSFSNLVKHAKGLDKLLVGIDWGGGGSNSNNPSFTTIAVGGLIPGTDTVKIIYGNKISPFESTETVVDILAKIISQISPDFIAHDYSSMGASNEVLLKDRGIPMNKMLPFSYILAPKKPIIYYNSPTRGFRDSYSIDKTRSIITLCTMIKHGKVKFPSWETIYEMEIEGNQETLLGDFMNVYQERSQSPRGNDLILIKQVPKTSDDWVHSINFICSGIWFASGKYPQVTEANTQLSNEDISDLVNPSSLR